MIIKKESVEVAAPLDLNEIDQVQNTPAQSEKQLKDMTIKEIIAECNSHYNCGDCKIIDFCHFSFEPFNLPHKWKLQEK